MSKSMIVSTLPFKLTEYKPGLTPSYYEVPAAPKDGISTLAIDDGFHLVLIPLSDDKAPPMKVTDLSSQIAKSLIFDYSSSCIGLNMDVQEDGSVAQPGLFWFEGILSIPEINKQKAVDIFKAKNNTNAWFKRLVVLADDDWQKNHMHKSITDLQRHACRHLGLEREWCFDIVPHTGLTLCWACKANVNPEAMICTACKAILNTAEYEKNKAKFATV